MSLKHSYSNAWRLARVYVVLCSFLECSEMRHKGLNAETLCQWKVFSIANEDSEQGLFSVKRMNKKRVEMFTHTFHRNVLDGEAEDYGPDHSQGHLSVAIYDL